MVAAEKIKAIASVFIQMKEEKPKWAFLTFPNIEQETDISKDEALPICELLREEKLVKYIFMPFDDHKKKFSIFSKDDDYQDETGAVAFVGITDGEQPFFGSIDDEGLKALVASETKLQLLARKLKPKIEYDAKKHLLIYKDKSERLTSHNHKSVCEFIFSKPVGIVFEENEVAVHLEKRRRNEDNIEYHYLYNVINQINLKIQKMTGIPHFIEFKGGQVRTT